MRAPPESFKPITGAPVLSARSMILQIFSAFDSESDPPSTVKSCAKTYTRRPNVSVARDEAVTVDDLLIHSEVGSAMPDQLVHLFESARVEQKIDALARR